MCCISAAGEMKLEDDDDVKRGVIVLLTILLACWLSILLIVW